MKRLIKLLIFPLILLSMFSCSSKTLNSSDITVIEKAVNTYLEADDAEVLFSWRNPDIKVDYVVVKSEKIAKTDRVDTILDENTKKFFYLYYVENEQLFALKNNKVYSIKDGYSDLVFNQDELAYISAIYTEDYYEKFKTYGDKNFVENGEVLVHEAKVIPFLIGYESTIEYRNSLMVLIDYAFFNHDFTKEDFSFIDIASLEKGPLGNSEHFVQINQCDNDGTPHHYYSITLKDTSKENLMRSIISLRNCYFIHAAGMERATMDCA